MWEVPLLAVISELAHRYRSPEMGVTRAVASLENKLAAFTTLTEGLDMSRFRLMDFGTRRRFSREVQQAIVKRLQQEPWFVGTSNYDRASPQPDADGHLCARVVPCASANQPGSG